MMSAREFRDWQAFAILEPFGDWRADFRSAIIASLVANANRDREKHPEPFSIEEFVPFFGKATEQAIDIEELDEEAEAKHRAALTAKIELLNRAFGGIDRRAAREQQPKPS